MKFKISDQVLFNILSVYEFGEKAPEQIADNMIPDLISDRVQNRMRPWTTWTDVFRVRERVRRLKRKMGKLEFVPSTEQMKEKKENPK